MYHLLVLFYLNLILLNYALICFVFVRRSYGIFLVVFEVLERCLLSPGLALMGVTGGIILRSCSFVFDGFVKIVDLVLESSKLARSTLFQFISTCFCVFYCRLDSSSLLFTRSSTSSTADIVTNSCSKFEDRLIPLQPYRE